MGGYNMSDLIKTSVYLKPIVKKYLKELAFLSDRTYTDIINTILEKDLKILVEKNRSKSE